MATSRRRFLAAAAAAVGLPSSLPTAHASRTAPVMFTFDLKTMHLIREVKGSKVALALRGGKWWPEKVTVYSNCIADEVADGGVAVLEDEQYS